MNVAVHHSFSPKPMSSRLVRNDEGAVMLLALLVSMLLAGLGVSAMWMSSSSTRISSNVNMRNEALNAAETAIDRGRFVLRAGAASWDNLLMGTNCSARYHDLNNKGAVLCDPDIAAAADKAVELKNLVSPETEAAKKYVNLENMTYTVWIRNDPIEFKWCNGVIDPGETNDTGECATPANGGLSGVETDVWRRTHDKDRRVCLCAEGVARDGISRVAIQAIVTPAAVQNMRETNYSGDGNDQSGAGSGILRQ